MKWITAAIVAAALTAAVTGCGSNSTKTDMPGTPTPVSSGTTKTPGGPGATASIVTTPPTPPPPIKTITLREFRSPTGDLGCVMYTGQGGGARCDIARRKWKPGPRPASCRLDYGQGLEVNGSEPGRLTCAGDTALNPHATLLRYGDASTVGHFTCISETNGMTCKNDTTNHGFFVSIDGYSLF